MGRCRGLLPRLKAAPTILNVAIMTSSPRPPEPNTASHDFIKQSSLYQEFLAEREEILRHKWLESERLGQDIGFERALLDWIRKHRESWRASRRGSTPPMPLSMAEKPRNGHAG